MKPRILTFALLILAIGTASPSAQIFTVLHSFTATSGSKSTNSDGALPECGLVLSGNTLYGTAPSGGNSGNGTVFKLNTDGSGFTNLHNFTAGPNTNGYVTNTDGAYPTGPLFLSGNTLYGTTGSGGRWGNGTVFKLSSDGTGFTNLHSFFGYPDDGAGPKGGLILSGSTLYGTTEGGGSNWDYGTVFKLNTDGTGFTNLHSFILTDGGYPATGLTLSGNTLYGTTTTGHGSSLAGEVFEVNTDGTEFAVLHGFNFTNLLGSSPYSSLVLSGNTLYGTTVFDGTGGSGTIFKVNTDTTGFAFLHYFNQMLGADFTNSDGANPEAGLILSGNTLYGTASSGGTNGWGTVFAVNTNAISYTLFTNLHNFAQTSGPSYTNSGGASPYSGLILSGNTLYGTTLYGGGSGNGTVFALSLGPIPLNIQLIGGAAVLNWGNPAFTLKSSPDISGVFTDVTGAASPYTNFITGPQMFFRLQAN